MAKKKKANTSLLEYEYTQVGIAPYEGEEPKNLHHLPLVKWGKDYYLRIPDVL